MNKEIKIGDKVIAYDNRRQFAQIVADHGDGEYHCQYIDEKGNLTGNAFMVDSEEISLYDPEADKQKAFIIQSKIDEANSALEKAFEAIVEVRSLTENDMHEWERAGLINLSDLEETMEEIGWGPSSLNC